jgi:hypothetical protein
MPEMTTEEAAEWGKTLGFEKVWAALMENREQLARLEKTVKRVSKNVGGLNRSVGGACRNAYRRPLVGKVSPIWPYTGLPASAGV